MTKNYYANGIVYPHFSFVFEDGKWIMTGNAGMTGDDGEYDSPYVLPGTPEEFMKVHFGDNWQ